MYKTIKRFVEGDLNRSIGAYTSLFEAVGFSNARNRAQLYGVFESGIRYIAADGADGGRHRRRDDEKKAVVVASVVQIYEEHEMGGGRRDD